MCSCSGSCNCNSTTIPRGPKGPTGQAATIAAGSATALPAGATPTVTNASSNPSAAIFNFGIPAGATGDVGPAGLNAYTTLTAAFTQPNFVQLIEITVANNSWVAVNQIIYIFTGGFYRVLGKDGTTIIELIRLNWTIPGVTFIAEGSQILSGSLVTPSGTIGANGTNGIDGDGITLVKSVGATFIPSVFTADPGDTFTLTSPSDIFKTNELCPNDGDVGRITYEAVAVKQSGGSTSTSNISLDIYFGISGGSIIQLDPFSESNSERNKLNNFIWSSGFLYEHLYIKYVIDIQRVTSTTANIFIDWKVKSASNFATGNYHNASNVVLDFAASIPEKYFEFAVKGSNNGTAVMTFKKSRFYVESLRQLPA
jgi:hypothetical protein